MAKYSTLTWVKVISATFLFIGIIDGTLWKFITN